MWLVEIVNSNTFFNFIAIINLYIAIIKKSTIAVICTIISNFVSS